MMNDPIKHYYECDFVPVGNAIIWLFEFNGTYIIREIGLNKENKVLYRLPNKEYPRGMFGDSAIAFNVEDLKPISSEEFEDYWERQTQSR